MDVFCVKELPFLIDVMSPLGLVQCAPLVNRGTDSVGDALRKFVSTGAGRGSDVLEVRCDGEGAIGALRDSLQAQGLKVELAGPGQHVPVVELMIKTVKQRVRAHEHNRTFVMTKVLLPPGACCFRAVRQPATQRTATDRTSPREQFTGRKLDAKRDLRCAFKDYVQATVPVTDNTMSPMTQA